ncbi:hypothetical protein RchiOBHm_Chr1g0369191 [Rosa chinensis]|uniref:Uncharacterized protein n=1 Tax=Rosa chinensis TaxID=74649 RepID=A0A2P6SKY3_ROSCH|nr:hypothetical protein RchiOBHm_Chr1g0369191 [Rosa chinensis]
MAQIAILSASASLIPFNSGGAKQLSKSLQLFSSRRCTTSTTTSSPSLTTIRFRSKRIGNLEFWARAAASHGSLGEVDEWTLPDNKVGLSSESSYKTLSLKFLPAMLVELDH